MSESVRRVNCFFRTAIKKDVDEIRERMILTDRQRRIFEMFYIKRLDIGFISDTVGLSPDSVNKELKLIRRKIVRALEQEL